MQIRIETFRSSLATTVEYFRFIFARTFHHFCKRESTLVSTVRCEDIERRESEKNSALDQIVAYKPYYVVPDFDGLKLWLDGQSYTNDEGASRVDL